MTEKKIWIAKEIFDYYPTICYAGVEHGGYRDIRSCDLLKNKKFISLEEHKKEIKRIQREYTTALKINVRKAKQEGFGDMRIKKKHKVK